MYAAVRRARPCGGQMVRDAAAQLSDGHDLPALRRLLRDYDLGQRQNVHLCKGSWGCFDRLK
jgi:hypothetical protein